MIICYNLKHEMLLLWKNHDQSLKMVAKNKQYDTECKELPQRLLIRHSSKLTNTWKC